MDDRFLTHNACYPLGSSKKLDRIKRGLKAIIVFMDEAGFSLHPKLGVVWAKKGTQPRVPTASCHKRLNLVGWVVPWVGWHGLMRIEKGNKSSFVSFLKYLHHRLKEFKVFLYADGASWHKSQEIQAALKEVKNIRMELLPPYHPELNPQERIWRLLRYEVTTNRYFPAVEAIGKLGLPGF